jgi:predicted Zn-dependent protease
VTKTRPTTINGLPAAHTRLGDSKIGVGITWIAHDGVVYQITGLAPAKRFDAVEPIFQVVTNSFRPLSREERAAIREERIRLVRARAGETVRSIAARFGAVWTAEQTAVANNVTDSEPLKEGYVIKIAVAEPYEGGNK